MTSVAAKQHAIMRALVLETADKQLAFARDMAKKARRQAAECTRAGQMPGADAFTDMAEAFEATEVAWTNVRARWARDEERKRTA